MREKVDQEDQEKLNKKGKFSEKIAEKLLSRHNELFQ